MGAKLQDNPLPLRMIHRASHQVPAPASLRRAAAYCGFQSVPNASIQSASGPAKLACPEAGVTTAFT